MKVPPKIIHDFGDYRIEADAHNWMISKKYTRKKSGEIYYNQEKFFSHFGDLLVWMFDKRMKDCGQLEEIKANIESIAEELRSVRTKVEQISG